MVDYFDTKSNLGRKMAEKGRHLSNWGFDFDGRILISESESVKYGILRENIGDTQICI